MTDDVGENRCDDRATSGAGWPRVSHEAKRNPEDGKECRTRYEVAVYVVEVEFLDQVSAPSAGTTLHF